MKKSFILISLLSSVAFAELQPTVDATLANGTDVVVSTSDTVAKSCIQWDTTKLDGTLESYMLTFNFSGTTVTDRQTIFTVEDGGDKSWEGGLSISANHSQFTLSYNGATNYVINWDDTHYGKDVLDINSADTYAFAYDGVNDVAYLMNLTAAQTNGAIYGTNYILLSQDNMRTDAPMSGWLGQANTLVSGTSKLWVKQATTTVGSVTDMSAVAIQGQDVKSFAKAMVTAVPEPATASLSLLALAGLAARRRRK